MSARAQHDIRVSSAILGADLTQGQKLVYIAVRSRQGAGKWCMSGQRELAKDINANKSHVNRSVAVLIERGWLEMHANGRFLKCLETPFGSEPVPAKSVRKLRTKGSNKTVRNQATTVRNQATTVRNQATTVRNQSPPSKSQLESQLESQLKPPTPFDESDFARSEVVREKWALWKRYKAEQFRFRYKPTSERAALTKLSNLSRGDPILACLIIEQSIANTWKGLFKPKDQARHDESKRNRYNVATDEQKRDILAAVQRGLPVDP